MRARSELNTNNLISDFLKVLLTSDNCNKKDESQKEGKNQ